MEALEEAILKALKDEGVDIELLPPGRASRVRRVGLALVSSACCAAWKRCRHLERALPYAEAFDLSLAVGRRLQAAQVAYHVAVEPGGDLRVFTHEEVEKQRQKGRVLCKGCGCFFGEGNPMRTHVQNADSRCFSAEAAEYYLKPCQDEVQPVVQNVKKTLDPALQAAKDGSLDTLRRLAEQLNLLELCDHHGNKAIHWAAGAGQLEVCRYLLAQRVDPAEPSVRHQNRRPLHWAARNGQVAVCSWLLEERCAVDAETNGGDTALMLAAWQGHVAVCQLLVQWRADVHHLNSWGCNAMHKAARMDGESSKLDMLEFLLSKGVDASLANCNGHNALHKVDIMQQCVNLQLETGNHHEVGDTDAYTEVIADFAYELWQGMSCWTLLEGEEVQQGIIHRVNREESGHVTYDFQYSKTVSEGGRSVSKAFIVKDKEREDFQTRQLLVKGDPAGGKTTFAKQLLTWIMRGSDQRLVPVMVRTIDLVRSHQQFTQGQEMVSQYLAMVYKDTGHLELLELARQNGRLLLLLDGFDEAGFLERDLAHEISSKLNHEVFLIVTSRDMSGVLSGPDFARFRAVRVKELNEEQRRQVIERRLQPQVVEAFCNQLTLNPALCVMTRNPLLLNVTLSVYETSRELGALSLNRGKVYGLALDGMLSNLESAKAVNRGGLGVTATALREVLKSIAFLAHSERTGRGVRDFRRELIHRAIRGCQLGAAFTVDHWNEVEDLIKKGRLPLLTWFSEEGEDTFRFAHLTFQEFLTAEYCLQRCHESGDFIYEMRNLICPVEPQQILERGWWQQSIQMFCDLAITTESEESWCTVLGECLLQLGSFTRSSEPVMSPASDSSGSSGPRVLRRMAGRRRTRVVDSKTVDFLELVNDSNILTVLSMLRDSGSVEQLKLGGGLSSSGIATIRSLQVKNLRGLHLNQNYIGPQGCVALADFLHQTQAPLHTLELVNNVICQGAAKENMLPISRRNPPTGYYDSYEKDLSGLEQLLKAIGEKPTMRVLDLRGNFLPLEAGDLLAQVVLARPNLEEVCGVELRHIRAQTLRELKLENNDYFFNAEYHSRQDAPFLSTGGAYFLVKLLLHYPQPGLTTLCLSNQALASDLQAADRLYEELGQALRPSQLQHLDLCGFWDSGAAAGAALGRHLALMPSLQTVRVGTGTLDFQQIRCASGELSLGRSRMRDCGAGIVSRCLPAHIQKLHLSGAGLGANGYKILSQCPSLQQINGVDLSAFQEATTRLDFSQEPALSSGSVAAILARTVLTPQLQYLNLSGCNFTSKSHIHPLTPVAGGSGGIGCNGGCDCRTFEGTNAYKHCADCDLDFCSTCCMSECPMITLADALKRLPMLVSLSLSDCSFQGGKMGPVRSHLDIDGYQVLGEALSQHPRIETLDISKNFFQGHGFPYLLRGVVEMKVLKTIVLGAEPLSFRDFLEQPSLEVEKSWLPVEVHLMCLAVRKNQHLRQLKLNQAHLDLKIDVVRCLVDSLECLLETCEPLDLLTISGLNLPLKRLHDGLERSLDLSCGHRSHRSALAPLFSFVLKHCSGLEDVNFCQNDFGPDTDHIVDAVLALQGLRYYNGISLLPSATTASFSMEKRPVMAHGLCVFASSSLPRQPLLQVLDLQSCGLDGRSLAAVLNSMLQMQSVTCLDISGQALKKAGIESLTPFLRQDKKLESLRAQSIATPSYYTTEMLELTRAMEVNSTLASLDLRGNVVHPGIAARLRRTMEEKRSVVPLHFDAKICFLLCNRRLPWHLQLPEVTQVCEVSRLFTGGAYSPLFMIFQFCGQPRSLFIDDVAEDLEVPATAWRPWNLHMGLPGMVPDAGHEALESDEDPATWGPPRFWSISSDDDPMEI